MSDFIDDLEKWLHLRHKKEHKKRQDVLVVEFLAMKKSISEAVDAGYSIKTIWEYLNKETGQIRSTYETFRRHVNRFIKRPQILAAKNTTPIKSKIEEKTNNDVSVIESKKTVSNTTFQYNAKPNKEDLI